MNISITPKILLCPLLHTLFNPPNYFSGKGRGSRDQIANIRWIIRKSKRVPEKKSIFALLTMPKPLTVWITIHCGKF